MTAIALTAVLVSGCSSKPRTFAPELAAPPVDQAAYNQALAVCELETMQAGGKDVSTGIAKGTGVAAIGGATASGASWGAAAAAGAAAVVAVPVVGLVWGIAKINRAKKERRIKEAGSQCLLGEGYAVASWKRVKMARKVEQLQVKPEKIERPEE